MTSVQQEKLIAGVDPGLASGGMVVVDSEDQNRVLAAYSLVEKKGAVKNSQQEAVDITDYLEGWSDKEFLAACLRADAWIASFREALAEIKTNFGLPEVFAVESFVDQRSRAREEKQRLVKNRWHTPLVMGMLAVALAEEGINIHNRRLIYQNAGIVIRQWSVELGKLKSRPKADPTDVVVPGDHQIRNDHQRKALVHALALSLRLRQLRRSLNN